MAPTNDDQYLIRSCTQLLKYGAKIYSGTNLLLYQNGLHENTLAGREGGYVGPGVTADGKKNSVIIPASQYYKAPRNIEEQFVYSASYVKLREVKLGYTLPAAWIKKIGFVSASVAVVGRNLWIIHKNVPNIDPEVAFTAGNAQGLEDLTLPTVRSYGFNINLKF